MCPAGDVRADAARVRNPSSVRLNYPLLRARVFRAAKSEYRASYFLGTISTIGGDVGCRDPAAGSTVRPTISPGASPDTIAGPAMPPPAIVRRPEGMAPSGPI